MAEVLPISPEVAIIARVAAADARSMTAANNRLIMETTGLDPWTATPVEVRDALRERENVMSDREQEDATILGRALEERDRLQQGGMDTQQIQYYINYICEN